MKYYFNIMEKNLTPLNAKVNHALQAGFELIGGLTYNTHNESYIQTMILNDKEDAFPFIGNYIRENLILKCTPRTISSKIKEILAITDEYLFVVASNGNVKMMDEEDIINFYRDCFAMNKNTLSAIIEKKQPDENIQYAVTLTRFPGDDTRLIKHNGSRLMVLLATSEHFEY